MQRRLRKSTDRNLYCDRLSSLLPDFITAPHAVVSKFFKSASQTAHPPSRPVTPCNATRPTLFLRPSPLIFSYTLSFSLTFSLPSSLQSVCPSVYLNFSVTLVFFFGLLLFIPSVFLSFVRWVCRSVGRVRVCVRLWVFPTCVRAEQTARKASSHVITDVVFTDPRRSCRWTSGLPAQH